jgi:hypothetical protein
MSDVSDGVAHGRAAPHNRRPKRPTLRSVLLGEDQRQVRPGAVHRICERCEILSPTPMPSTGTWIVAWRPGEPLCNRRPTVKRPHGALTALGVLVCVLATVLTGCGGGQSRAGSVDAATGGTGGGMGGSAAGGRDAGDGATGGGAGRGSGASCRSQRTACRVCARKTLGVASSCCGRRRPRNCNEPPGRRRDGRGRAAASVHFRWRGPARKVLPYLEDCHDIEGAVTANREQSASASAAAVESAFS